MEVTGVLLLFFAFRAYFAGSSAGKPTISPLSARLVVAGYCAITCAFAWIRATLDSGLPLLVGAAIHNLFEWYYFCILCADKDQVRRWIPRATAFMWIVMTVMFGIPQFFGAFLWEQTIGQTCDYFMVMLAVYRYMNAENAREKQMFKYLLYATIWHFGQIWTLIVKGVFPTGNIAALMEWGLLFSCLPTYYYYNLWAKLWDEAVYECNNRAAEGKKDEDANKGDHHDPRTNFPRGLLVAIVIVSFIISATVILGPLVVIPECPAQVQTP